MLLEGCSLRLGPPVFCSFLDLGFCLLGLTLLACCVSMLGLWGLRLQVRSSGFGLLFCVKLAKSSGTIAVAARWLHTGNNSLTV